MSMVHEMQVGENKITLRVGDVCLMPSTSQLYNSEDFSGKTVLASIFIGSFGKNNLYFFALATNKKFIEFDRYDAGTHEVYFISKGGDTIGLSAKLLREILVGAGTSLPYKIFYGNEIRDIYDYIAISRSSKWQKDSIMKTPLRVMSLDDWPARAFETYIGLVGRRPRRPDDDKKGVIRVARMDEAMRAGYEKAVELGVIPEKKTVEIPREVRRADHYHNAIMTCIERANYSMAHAYYSSEQFMEIADQMSRENGVGSIGVRLPGGRKVVSLFPGSAAGRPSRLPIPGRTVILAIYYLDENHVQVVTGEIVGKTELSYDLEVIVSTIFIENLPIAATENGHIEDLHERELVIFVDTAKIHLVDPGHRDSHGVHVNAVIETVGHLIQKQRCTCDEDDEEIEEEVCTVYLLDAELVWG